MRNLKKVLSLALALVMLIGMMVIGAGAVETKFVDDGKIGDNYKEAVAVMSAIKVLGGKENNNFDPKGTLTRAEAAKILCVMTMGSDAAEGLASVTKSGVFTDMPDHWAAGYVDACYNKGIVLGMAQGIYGPSNTLTGTQFAAMLLRAMGVEGEFTGPSWESAVIAAAGKAKLSEVTTKPIAREAASKMAFDGLLYSPSGEKAYKVGNLTFDSFLEAYIAADGVIDDISVSTASDSLATTVFGLAEDAKTDAFGNPTKVWTYDNEDVVTVPGAAATKTYTEKKSSLTDDLKGFSFKDAKLYEDGKETPIADSANAATTIQPKTGNGTQVMVYANNKVISKVVVVKEYVGSVARVTEAKGDDARTVTVDSMKFETEEFEKDDVVLYTKAYNADSKKYDIKTMVQPEFIENVEVTKTTGTGKATIDGEDHVPAATLNHSFDTANIVKVGGTIDMWLDSYGYVVKTVVNKGVTDFAYVIQIGADSTRYDDNTKYFAKMLMLDGNVVEGELSAATVASVTDGNANGKKDELSTKYGDKVVKFSKNSSDVYSLDETVQATTGDAKAITITHGNAAMTLTNADKAYYADSKTVFLVKNGNEYDVYTGYDEVPTLTGTGKYRVAVAASGSAVAKVVYVEGVTASNKDVVFVLKTASDPSLVSISGTSYYEYPAVVNGEITTVRLDETIVADELWSAFSYSNKANEVIDASAATDVGSVTNGNGMVSNQTVNAAVNNGIITIGSTSYPVDDDTQVYLCDDSSIVAASINDVEEGATAIFTVVTNGKVSSLFYKENTTPTTPEEPDKPVATGDYKVDISTASAVKVLVYKDCETKDDLDTAIAAIKAELTAKKWTVNEVADDNVKVTFKATNAAGTARSYVWTYDNGSGVKTANWAVNGIKINIVSASGTAETLVAPGDLDSLTGVAAGTYAKQVTNATTPVTSYVDVDTTAMVDGYTYEFGYVSLTIDGGSATYIKAGQAYTAAKPNAKKGTGFQLNDGSANSYLVYGGTFTPAANKNYTLTSEYITVTVAFKSGITGWTNDATSTSYIKVAASQAVSVVLKNSSNALTTATVANTKYAISGGLTVAETAFGTAVLSDSNHTYTLGIAALDASSATNNITLTVNDLGLGA